MRDKFCYLAIVGIYYGDGFEFVRFASGEEVEGQQGLDQFLFREARCACRGEATLQVAGYPGGDRGEVTPAGIGDLCGEGQARGAWGKEGELR